MIVSNIYKDNRKNVLKVLPFLRSSMNSSSKIPSSPRKGSCLLSALPGKGGTTIWKIIVLHTWVYSQNTQIQVNNLLSSLKRDFKDNLHYNAFYLVSLIINKNMFIIKWWLISVFLTLLSLSSSFLSHSKSLYRRLTLDSLTLNTGKLVWKEEYWLENYKRPFSTDWRILHAADDTPTKSVTYKHWCRVNR